MMPYDTHNIVIHADISPAGEHMQRFNAPTIVVVGIVTVGDQLQKRYIVLHRRNDPLTIVAETHRRNDALQYPIIFGDGPHGYNFNFTMINPVSGEEPNKKCSVTNYYSYRLMIQDNEGKHILKCRQLFH